MEILKSNIMMILRKANDRPKVTLSIDSSNVTIANVLSHDERAGMHKIRLQMEL